MPRKKRRSHPPRSSLSAWDELFPTLDLHGETADDACRRAERWLREQAAEGIRTVRLITGRGVHSVGPPVLRGEIGSLLQALRGTLVADFGVDTGGGAFRVELKRRPRPRQSAGAPPIPRRAPRASGETPELRRQAEEALWELGVSPTPALIDAEVRRILDDRERKTS